MRIDDQLQYDIKGVAAKISALLSGKIIKCEYLTCEETLPHDQSRMIGQAKFTYLSLKKHSKNKQKQSNTKEEIKLKLYKL